MVVNGSLSKTAVNGSAGARTQMSGLVVAALTILTLLFLTGLFEDLPEATLGAVVIAALIELVDISALRALYRAYTERLGQIYGPAARADFIAAVAAMLGVLIFDTLPGLFIGIAVSLLLLLYRVSRPHVAVLGQVPGTSQWADVAQHPEDETDPRRRDPAGRVRFVLRQRRPRAGHDQRGRHGRGHPCGRAGRRNDPVRRCDGRPHARRAHRRPAPPRGAAGHRPRRRPGPRRTRRNQAAAAAPEYFPSVRAAVDAVRADPASQVAGPTSTVKET